MSDWLNRPRSLHAAERILDAAAELFAERGVAETQMGDIAKAAGCSRATLYRYFDSRRAVRLAYVHREARRVGAAVGAEIADIADPGQRMVAGVLASVRMVRADPLLIAWFNPGDAGLTLDLAQNSPVIEAIGGSLLGSDQERGSDEPGRPDATAQSHGSAQLGRWLTRIIVSLLTVPGRDEADERELLERFLAPLIATPR
ncbi:TetR/AcrR family transcriptional regulator [Nocardia vermiculata]|uniref:TetR/AcrR family transcriptional regulator n=1 Tax=Nocardia vermiculata TaxID=257274 RepID=A0A846Y0K0_9NOCA|nr:TetR/AcrR family transcriptional regulator [Nocardia vermiculata]NKY52367.1 TetR/AcrR family transcriptional regulator [Nocardia vermiculata]